MASVYTHIIQIHNPTNLDLRRSETVDCTHSDIKRTEREQIDLINVQCKTVRLCRIKLHNDPT